MSSVHSQSRNALKKINQLKKICCNTMYHRNLCYVTLLYSNNMYVHTQTHMCKEYKYIHAYVYVRAV